MEESEAAAAVPDAALTADQLQSHDNTLNEIEDEPAAPTEGISIEIRAAAAEDEEPPRPSMESSVTANLDTRTSVPTEELQDSEPATGQAPAGAASTEEAPAAVEADDAVANDGAEPEQESNQDDKEPSPLPEAPPASLSPAQEQPAVPSVGSPVATTATATDTTSADITSAAARPAPLGLRTATLSTTFRLPPHFKSVVQKKSTQALDLERALLCGGYDHVHFLSGEQEALVYTSGHTVVLHTLADNTQRLLRGHRHRITCTAASRDGRWLATADAGRDAMLIIWDTVSGAPVRTYFAAQLGAGCAALDMAADAMHVVTLSTATPAVLAVWDWTAADRDTPLVSITLPAMPLTFVRMHSDNPRQIVVSSSSEVLFVDWELSGASAVHAPSSAALALPTLAFTHSAFVPGEPIAVTASSRHVVVWEDAKSKSADGRYLKVAKKAVEVARSPILCLYAIESGLLALGCADGTVLFLDKTLKAVAWTHELRCGPIASLDFAAVQATKSETFRALRGTAWPAGGTSLNVPDFVVATREAVVVRVSMRPGEELTGVLLRGPHAAAGSADQRVALAAHPSRAVLAIVGRAGMLQLVDTDTYLPLCSSSFSAAPSCLAFSPDGSQLAVGLASGAVHVLDALSLQPLSSATIFAVLASEVAHVAWAADGRFLAAAADRCLALFSKQADFDAPYLFVGRIRAHHKPISAVLFGADPDTAAPRLLTLGLDRMLVEYDLAGSSFAAGVLVRGSSVRVDQAAVPHALAWHPDTESEAFLLLANDAAKLKLVNATTKMCRRTVRGPVFGAPIDRLLVLPLLPSCPERFVAFSCGENIGLMMLPLDGNPHHYSACVAHPGPVSSLAASHDGSHLFSAGADGSVHVWALHAGNAAAAAQLGGAGLVPFINMLEGGADGELLRDMEDYFYFSQIRRQGVANQAQYKVAARVPLVDVPDIMRAVGYFPSEDEIQNMTNEVKFSSYVNTGAYVTDVDLATCIRLYVNHRPVFGVSQQMVDAAFGALGGAVDTTALLEMLQRKGEHMTDEELQRCLALLVGDAPAEKLRATTTGVSFASDILGFAPS